MNPDGSVFNVDPWKAFFNPSFGTSAFHVVITAYATGAAVIASIVGFKLLKKNLSTREIAYHKKGATIRACRDIYYRRYDVAFRARIGNRPT